MLQLPVHLPGLPIVHRRLPTLRLPSRLPQEIYDSYGDAGLKGSVPTGPNGATYQYNPTNAEDIFEQFFGSMGGAQSGMFAEMFGGPHGMGGGGMGGPSMFFSTAQGRPQGIPRAPWARPSGAPFGMGGPIGRDSPGMGVDTGGRPAGMHKGEAIELPLRLSLEELYTGVQKNRRLTRKVCDQATGRMHEDTEMLTIDVKPGWKPGTKITFQGKGDEKPGCAPSDIVFVVEEKPHPSYVRKGNDLVHTLPISLEQALRGGLALVLPTLDGRTVRVEVPEPVQPDSVKVVRGEGMPIAKARLPAQPSHGRRPVPAHSALCGAHSLRIGAAGP